MTAQLVQQRLHIFPFLFRERWRLAPGLLSLVVMERGTVGVLCGPRAPRFLTSLWSSRLFSDGTLVLGSAASCVPICQKRVFFGSFCSMKVRRCVVSPRLSLLVFLFI